MHASLLRSPELKTIVETPRARVPDVLRWLILFSAAASVSAWVLWGQYAALPALGVAALFAVLRVRSIRRETRTYLDMETALDRGDKAAVLAGARRVLSSKQRRRRIEAAVWSLLAELAWREGSDEDALALCDHVAAGFPGSKVGRFQALCLKGLVLGLRSDVQAASRALDDAAKLVEQFAVSSVGAAQLRLSRVALHIRAGRIGDARALLGDEELFRNALDAHRRKVFEELRLELASTATRSAEHG